MKDRDRGQLLDAAVWAAFGVVVLVAAWRVDRLENLGINPWSIPGLLPGLVGALMILFAVVLGLRKPLAEESAAPAAPGARDTETGMPPVDADDGARGPSGASEPPESAGGMLRAAAAAVPCVLFALLGPATRLPFAADAAIYIGVFIVLFSWPRWHAEGRILRKLLVSLAIALVAGWMISWLFESVFLVRLP